MLHHSFERRERISSELGSVLGAASEQTAPGDSKSHDEDLLASSAFAKRLSVSAAPAGVDIDALAIACLFEELGRAGRDWGTALRLSRRVEYFLVASRGGKLSSLADALSTQRGCWVARRPGQSWRVDELSLEAHEMGGGLELRGEAPLDASSERCARFVLTARQRGSVVNACLGRDELGGRVGAGRLDVNGLTLARSSIFSSDSWTTQAALAQNFERLCLASYWVGVGQNLLDRLAPALQSQHAFGRRLSRFQSLRLQHAQLLVTCHAGVCLMLSSAAALGAESTRVKAEPLSLQLFVAERVFEVVASVAGAVPEGVCELGPQLRDLGNFRSRNGGTKLTESVLAVLMTGV